MAGLNVVSNPTALTAQFSLTRNMGSFADTLTRLSTGLKLNSGKDDPAGLIADSQLKLEITGAQRAVSNTEKANSILAVADSGLSQISSLLNDIKGLVVESANEGAMSVDQIAANQLQVDASIASIDRIAQTTSFQGKKLLDGSLGFRTSCIDKSTISALSIYSANFGTASAIDVDVQVLEAAKKGTLIYNGSGVSQKTTIDVTGSVGTKSFTFGAGTSNDAIAAAINAASDSTGVSAYVEGAASRGSVTLSSAGANNDIVITANEAGLEAGNYTFRIVKGDTEDVRIVSEPTSGKPGVVEIMVKKSYEAGYNDFAGLFNITIDGQYAVDNKIKDDNDAAVTAEQAQTSVTMTRGTANTAIFFQQDSSASATTSNGKTWTVDNASTNMSAYNGWTVIVDDTVDAAKANGIIDQDNKTIRINSEKATSSGIGGAFDLALGNTSGSTTFTISGDDLVSGDKMTFGNGGSAGELFVTYKEGATVEDIRKIIDNTPYVSATLANGVSGSQLVPMLPKDSCHESRTWTTPGTANSLNAVDPYTSATTAQKVIDMINSKLGDKFTATSLNGEGTGGRVSYMNAAVVYGDVNLDNAIRFTGWDAQPAIRTVTAGPNQELGVKIIYPSETDLANGISTPILQITLATDASGNSITTAKDIVDLFDRLTPKETLGVSAELMLPDGVDPNGRVWVTDQCGNTVQKDMCTTGSYGQGVVQPTGYFDECCRMQGGDMYLLGDNQVRIPAGQPVARIYSANGVTPQDAIASNSGKTVNIDFGETSSLNGMTFTFTSHADKAGFDAQSGLLTIFVDPTTRALAGDEFDAAIKELIDGQIVHNWADIREWTKAIGDPPEVQSIVYANDYYDLKNIIDVNSGEGILYIGDRTGGGGGKAAAAGKSAPMRLSFANEDPGEPFDLIIQFETLTKTDALNGVTIKGGSTTSWDAATKTLTVGNMPTTTDPVGLANDLADAINAALTQEAQNIKDATGSLDPDVPQINKSTFKITVEPPIPPTAIVTITQSEFYRNLGTISGGVFDDGTGPKINGQLGIGPTDQAMKITAKEKGLGMADAKVVILEDTSLALGQIAVAYDEKSKMLTITGNPGATGSMATDQLASLLNSNETFQKYCEQIDLVFDITPDTEIAFAKSSPLSAPFVGGYEIITSENQGNSLTNHTGTSSGIGMTGASDANERLVLQATEAGSKNFVDVSVAQGSFDTFCPLGIQMCHLAGTDMVATINGLAATADGNNLSLNTADLSLSLTVANQVGRTGFSITGGGMLFQLGGDVVSSQQMRIGMINASSTGLGGVSGKLFQLRSGGEAAMDTNTMLADRIVSEAINSVATYRGRIGAVQRNTLDQNIVSLQDQLTAMSSAEAALSNADFAQEASNKVRFDLLIQAGMSVLAQANQFPNYALSLLR